MSILVKRFTAPMPGGDKTVRVFVLGVVVSLVIGIAGFVWLLVRHEWLAAFGGLVFGLASFTTMALATPPNMRMFEMVDRDILYSILNRDPKRADAYWFISVNTTDQPYQREYEVETFGTDFLFRVNFNLGFKVRQSVNVYLYQLVKELLVQPAQPWRRRGVGGHRGVCRGMTGDTLHQPAACGQQVLDAAGQQLGREGLRQV